MKKFLGLFIATIAMGTLVGGVKADELNQTCLESNSPKTCTASDSDVTIDADVTINDNITLDLNGKTLTTKKITVSSGKKLTVKNGTIKTTTPDDLFEVLGELVLGEDESNLVVENAASTGNKIVVRLKTGANVTVAKNTTLKGGVGIMAGAGAITGVNVQMNGIINTTGSGLYVNGTNTASIGTFNVTGTITSQDAAVYAAGQATWNFTGANVTGTEALSIKRGDFTINGGNYTGNGDFFENPTAESSASEYTGAAISVTNTYGNGTVKLDIKDGNVTSENGYAIFEYKTKDEQASALNTTDGLVIEKGKFKSASGKDSVAIKGISNNTDNATIKIKGGEFSKMPSDELLTDGSTAELISTSSGSGSNNNKDKEDKDDEEEKENPTAPEANKQIADAKNPGTSDNFIVFISFVITGLLGFVLAAHRLAKN